MVRLIGKGRAWYGVTLAALLMAALFCGCAGDADNAADILSETQLRGNEEQVPGESGPVYTEAGYAFNDRFLGAFPWDKYGDYTLGLFKGDTNIILVSNETELRELFGETYSIAFSYEENGFAKNAYFQDAISKYNEDYFKDHQLLTFFLGAGYGGDRHELESVVYTDGVLTVTFNYLLAGGTAAIEHWFAIVEIDSIPADTRIDIVERNQKYADPDSSVYRYPHHYMFTLAKPGLNIKPALNVQYIRTEFFPFAEHPIPPITIVSSKEDMEQYYEKHKNKGWDLDGNLVPDYDFLDAIEKYSDDYFADNYLVIVRIVEGSGSILHKVERIDKNGDIVINRLLPEMGTCDMAAWSILIELNNNFEAEQFKVVLVDVSY
jgi:hypothetical protein